MTAQEAPEANCPFCLTGGEDPPGDGPVLWEDDLWYVRHAAAPYGVAGWMTLYTKRHTPSPAYFAAAEAAAFGGRLSHLERVLEEVTGALRIYTASMNEAYDHFHCHMVPRYAQMPGNVRTWGVFDLQRRSRAGDVTVDPSEVEQISERYRARLASTS
jgi:diadenosine tetraphosphate (Ap4A) HIT family hydrolase